MFESHRYLHRDILATLSVEEEREIAEILWELCNAPRQERKRLLQDLIASRVGREAETAREETLVAV